MSKEVLVVIGGGGIGQAIARRQGSGKTVLLADINQDTLEAAVTALQAAGHTVTTHPVDVSSRKSVRSLADAAAGLGSVVQVVHTAGLSPVQASPTAILAVDLLGVALVLEEFGRVIAPGRAGILISSMAGYMPPPLPSEQNEALAHTSTDQLLQLPFLSTDAVPNSGAAYALSKRANHLRVQAASVDWGERGAGRVGTTDEIASAAAYLLGADAAFITGSDLLIDGGVIAAMRSGRLNLPR